MERTTRPLIIQTLNEMLEEERAAVEAVIGLTAMATDPNEREQLQRIGGNEVWACGGLRSAIETLGGVPSRHISDFATYVLSLDYFPERLRTFGRHQRLILERISTLVNHRKLEESTKNFLEEMYTQHAKDIMWCEQRAQVFEQSRYQGEANKNQPTTPIVPLPPLQQAPSSLTNGDLPPTRSLTSGSGYGAPTAPSNGSAPSNGNTPTGYPSRPPLRPSISSNSPGNPGRPQQAPTTSALPPAISGSGPSSRPSAGVPSTPASLPPPPVSNTPPPSSSTPPPVSNTPPPSNSLPLPPATVQPPPPTLTATALPPAPALPPTPATAKPAASSPRPTRKTTTATTSAPAPVEAPPPPTRVEAPVPVPTQAVLPVPPPLAAAPSPATPDAPAAEEAPPVKARRVVRRKKVATEPDADSTAE